MMNLQHTGADSDWLAQFLSIRIYSKNLFLTVAMATEKSPIKVPCENEDLPKTENATGGDTLQGDISAGSILASVLSGFFVYLRVLT